jgi:hypothetical protein
MLVASVTAGGLDEERVASFLRPARGDRRVAGDVVAAFAGFRPRSCSTPPGPSRRSTGRSC